MNPWQLIASTPGFSDIAERASDLSPGRPVADDAGCETQGYVEGAAVTRTDRPNSRSEDKSHSLAGMFGRTSLLSAFTAASQREGPLF
jgi:hypothetical protein